jgi:hypothetical protein
VNQARQRAQHRHAKHGVVPESLYRHIAASIAVTPSARTRTSARVAAALAVAGAMFILIVCIASDFVYDQQAVGLWLGVESLPRLIATSVLATVLAATVTVAALWRGRHGCGAPELTLMTSALLAAPMYALITLIEPVHTSNAGVSHVAISPWGTRCLLIAALVGSIVLSALTLALQRAAPVATRSRAASIGACAGAWAGLAVFIFCPSGDQQHLFFGHVLPLVGFTALGALVSPRLLRP